MPKLQLLREQHAAAVKAAETLLALEAPTEEQQAEIETQLALAEKLQKDILTHERAGNVKTFAARSNGTPPAHAPLPATPEEKPNTGYQLSTPPRGYKSECFESNDDAHLCGLWALGVLGDSANPEATRKMRQAREWCLENREQFTLGQTEFDDMAGGMFVPVQMEGAIDHLRQQYGVIRSAVKNVPASSDSIKWTRPLKGVTIHPIGEVTPTPMTTESTALGDTFELFIKGWGGWARMSRDLDDDATVSIADMLVRDFAYQMAYAEDNTCFNGTGTLATYNGIEGIMNKIQGAAYTAAVSTALSGNNTFATLDLVDFEAVLGKLPFYPGARNRWYISKAGYFASMARLMDAAGGNTKDDIAGGTGTQFLGSPVVFTEVLNSTLGANADAYVALYGDLSLAATFGNRRGMTVETDYSIYRHNRQVGLFVTSRWGFTVHDLLGTDGAGNSIAGPVIALRMAS